MAHGGPDALEVVDLPEVHAGPDQVRARIHAAAVNPTDTLARNGSRAEQQKADPPPYVPGMDAAGIVDEVGDGVSTGVQVGDTVMAMVVPAPAGATHVEACTLPKARNQPGRARSHGALYQSALPQPRPPRLKRPYWRWRCWRTIRIKSKATTMRPV